MSFPYLPYIFTEICCIFFAASILFRLNRSIGTEHEVRELRNMIYAYFVMLISDIVWALFEDNILTAAPWVNLTMGAMLIMSISLGCYFWFVFIMDRLHHTRPMGKRTIFLFSIPIILLCALDVLSIFTRFLFTLNRAGHYESTDWFVIQTVTNYFYLSVPTIACVHRAVTTHSRWERKEYSIYACYMIAPMIGGMLESVFPLLPVLAMSIYMIINILFLMIQNLQIYNDALTDLNNRRRLDQFLDERLPRVSAERPLTVMMIDINAFKAINDACGHIEGDRALRTFSDVLKKAAAQHDAFLARYGGDEFCFVASAAGCTPADLADEIHARLRRAQEGADKPYVLSASIGYTLCDRPENDSNAVLARADEMLYRSKQQWHQESGRPTRK